MSVRPHKARRLASCRNDMEAMFDLQIPEEIRRPPMIGLMIATIVLGIPGTIKAIIEISEWVKNKDRHDSSRN